MVSVPIINGEGQEVYMQMAGSGSQSVPYRTFMGEASVLSSSNNSTTPLSGSGTFTGTGEQNGMPQVAVSCKTDADGVLYFDFSNDGTNWDTFPTSGFTVFAGIHEYHTARKDGRYFRVRFVNGSAAQSYLRLYTYFTSTGIPNAPLNQTATLDQDAIFTRSTVPQDEIRIGRRSGVNGWNKFAYKSSLTAAAGEQMIWGDGDNFTPMTTAQTFTITYDGTGGGSTDGSGTTGARTLYFFYIDEDGLPAEATHVLGTDGSDVTSFTGLGINRIAVASAGTHTFNRNTITVTATSSATVQAVIPAEAGVTQQAIFFVGSNHLAVAKYLWMCVLRTTGGSSPRVTIKAYVYNRNLAVRYLVFRTIIDTAVQNTIEISEPIGFNFSPTDILYFVADTNTDGTEIDLRFSLNEYRRT